MGDVVKTATIHRLIKRAGAERVSQRGAKLLSDILEKQGLHLAKKAIMFSRHAGRKTVMKRDIEAAFTLALTKRIEEEGLTSLGSETENLEETISQVFSEE